MFNNYESDVVGFSSSWKTEKTLTDGGCQTTEFSTSESSTATNSSQTVAIQTEPLRARGELPERAPTPPGLANWLQNIAPLVLKELSLNITNSVLRDYDPYADDYELEPKATLLQTVRCEAAEVSSTPNKHESMPYPDGDSQLIEKFPVSGISWSCAGNTLAVLHGKFSHTDWCQHDGRVDIYIKSGQTDLLKHNAELKLPSCGSSVAFHPSEPALLASATVSGEVSVWNLQRLGDGASPLIGSSSSPHLSRRISALLWLTDRQVDKFVKDRGTSGHQILASCGFDGKVVLWLVNFAASTFAQHICFEVNEPIDKGTLPPDISCLDFRRVWSSEDDSELAEDTFVVGCKTGEIFVCRTSTAKPIAASQNLNPWVSELEPHGAAVLRVSFTAGAPGTLLLSLGADLEIRTYSLPQSYPLQVVYLDHGISYVDWLPGSNSVVLATVGEAKHTRTTALQVYDVLNGKPIPVDGLETEIAEVGSEPCGLTSLAFNTKSVNMVACGDMAGDVKIWNIPFKNISIPHLLSL